MKNRPWKNSTSRGASKELNSDLQTSDRCATKVNYNMHDIHTLLPIIINYLVGTDSRLICGAIIGLIPGPFQHSLFIIKVTHYAS